MQKELEVKPIPSTRTQPWIIKWGAICNHKEVCDTRKLDSTKEANLIRTTQQSMELSTE